MALMPRKDDVLYFSPQSKSLCHPCRAIASFDHRNVLLRDVLALRTLFLEMLLPSLRSVSIFYEVCSFSCDMLCAAHQS